jgi:L-rhamnose mutarotase
MERLALVYRVKEGKKEEYIKAHNNIWPEITRGMKEAGCREMTIFSRGNLLFLFALIDDIDEFNMIRSKDPSFQRWNSWMHELLEHPFDDKEPTAFARLDEIWHFEADRI